jgi:lysosomal alpha-mannosidase
MGGVSEQGKICGIFAWILFLCCFSGCCLFSTASPNRIHVSLHLLPHSHVDPMWKSSPHEYSKTTNKILEGAVMSLIQNPNRTFIWESVFFLDVFLTSHGSQNICDLFASQLEQKETKKWCGVHLSSRCCSVKDAVMKLFSNGQLELVGGGWVSHDESLTDYESKLDNFVAGRRWITQKLGPR